MSKAAAVPDAWDDDWEAQADSAAAQKIDNAAAVQPPLTKAERLTQHAETNRRLWESADSPQTFHFLEANNNVPLTSGFKPQVRVLSRKPVVAKKDPVSGMARLTVDDGGDDGADGDAGKKETQLSPDEVRAKQKRDREEKQRRYDEARAKIFGESAPSSRGSSPGTVTPPRSDGRHSSQRSGPRPRGAPRNHFDGRQQSETRRQGSQAGPPRELYDPNLSLKPDSASQRRTGTEDDAWRSLRPRDDAHQPIRAPRGPDGSGRGGFGFARRGARES